MKEESLIKHTSFIEDELDLSAEELSDQLSAGFSTWGSLSTFGSTVFGCTSTVGSASSN